VTCQEFDEARSVAETEDEKAGGHGIEGAGVADAALTGYAPDLCYDVVAGPTVWLVDEEDAVKAAITPLAHGIHC
jgi:hypothetical protein